MSALNSLNGPSTSEGARERSSAAFHSACSATAKGEFAISRLVRAPRRVLRLLKSRCAHVPHKVGVDGAAGDVVLLGLGEVDPVGAQ